MYSISRLFPLWLLGFKDKQLSGAGIEPATNGLKEVCTIPTSTGNKKDYNYIGRNQLI
jgi:hypothetical protein